MSELNLPEPVNWSRTGKLPKPVRFGLAVFFMYVVFVGVRALVSGSYLTVVIWFGTFSFAFFMTAFVAWVGASGVTTRTSTDASGFTFWPDRRLTVGYFVGLAVTCPAALAFAILLPRAMIDIPMSRGMQIFAPPALYAIALIALSALVAGWRRGGVGLLKFTPAMIEIADALKTRVLEWDDVIDVRDHASTKKANRAGRSAVLCLRDGGEQVIGGLHHYVRTGVPLYWLIRHYWKHPDDRDELVDDRALQRFRNRRYDLT